jgi:ubiquinone/menaquinone biosynthesis C-methylase UbiE
MSLSIYEKAIDPILKDIRELVPEAAGIKEGGKALDVCCGTGAQSLIYARHGIISYGIDNSPDMIATANKNKTRYKLDNAFFTLGDAGKLPYEDNYFDYVSISFAIHDKECPLRDRIIGEMKRVSKEDGALVFIDFNNPLPRNLYGFAVRFIEFLAGGSHYRGFREYNSNGGLPYILTNHGLKVKSNTVIKKGIAIIVTARKS